MQHPATRATVLVVGAGVSGMQAALDLANMGKEVLLIEKNTFLGGQVMRLDKVYPTDHCAFCPVWPYAKACREHPRINILMDTEFIRMVSPSKAHLRKKKNAVDRDLCLFCCACIEACPENAIQGGTADTPWNPASPPSVAITASKCTMCGACVHICPTRAISLDVLQHAVYEDVFMDVCECILASGFIEPNPAPAPEFGAHTHPDILTAMAFETWTAEFRTSYSPQLLCPSDQRVARSIAFIQCAGARDQRYLPYCSAVCCMHACKQARWLKRRNPELDITIFYTDLRSPGKGQEAYVMQAQRDGIQFVRMRPGLVYPLDAARHKGILVRYEQQKTVGSLIADIVVLNGGLVSCPQLEKEKQTAVACGFCKEPGDIAQSVIQGSQTAFDVLMAEKTE